MFLYSAVPYLLLALWINDAMRTIALSIFIAFHLVVTSGKALVANPPHLGPDGARRAGAAQNGEHSRDHQHLEAYEQFAATRFAELNEKSRGKLNTLFEDFTAIAHARWFMQDKATAGLYREFLVATLQAQMDGDVMEAIFANFIMRITPPEIVLDAVVPELGTSGKLPGILGDPRIDLGDYLGRHSLEGRGKVDFRYYAAYFRNHKNEGLPGPLIKHMFRTAPGEAMQAMLSGTFGLSFPVEPKLRGARVKKTREIRELLLAEHLLSDLIWRKEFNFDIGPQQLNEGKQVLAGLSMQKHWWARLYAAEILHRHPEFRTPELMQRLQNDEHNLVRQAITETESGAEKPNRPPVQPADADGGQQQ